MCHGNVAIQGCLTIETGANKPFVIMRTSHILKHNDQIQLQSYKKYKTIHILIHTAIIKLRGVTTKLKYNIFSPCKLSRN